MTDLPSDGRDRLCTIILRARVSRQAQQNPLSLPANVLLRCPALLATLDSGWLANPNFDDGLPVDAIADHLAAASMLIDVDLSEDEETHPPGALLASLREILVDTGRIELLGTLASTAMLQPHERSQLHRRALEIGDENYNQARRLERAWLACDELVHPVAAQFRTIATDALERCNAEGREAHPFEPLLLSSWISQQVLVAESAMNEIIQVRTTQAKSRSSGLGKVCTTPAAATADA